jgi:hypothetical protein
VLHLVRELRGICSNRSAVAWGAPLIRWSDDGAIVLAARPIASLLQENHSIGSVKRASMMALTTEIERMRAVGPLAAARPSHSNHSYNPASSVDADG